MRHVTLAMFLGLGCTPTDSAPTRPEGAPDVLILAISGHCVPLMGLCDGDFNPEYLSHAGTIDVVADALFERGLAVQWAAFNDGWYAWVDADGELLVAGFSGLVSTLEMAQREWIDGVDNPTRVVLIGHGHGAVWTHMAALALPGLAVDVMVDLDGMSAGWDDTDGYLGVGDAWPEEIPGYVEEGDRDWAIDAWEAADSWAVEGLDAALDVEDFVPDNVLLNLEVRSRPSPQQVESGVYDGQDNHRLDGTTVGVRSCESLEDHYGVYEPATDCMDWVVDEVVQALRSGRPARR